jgi:hypothetical protein
MLHTRSLSGQLLSGRLGMWQALIAELAHSYLLNRIAPLRRDLKHHTAALAAAASSTHGRRAKDISAGIANYAAVGISSLADFSEVVQIDINPSTVRWRQLKHPTSMGHPIGVRERDLATATAMRGIIAHNSLFVRRRSGANFVTFRMAHPADAG